MGPLDLKTFSTAADGYYAIYVEDERDSQQPTLRNVIGWATLETKTGEPVTVAYVPHPYTDKLVRANSLPGFISLIGPNPQSDHKAGAARIVNEAQAHRSASLAREANRRRARSHRTDKGSVVRP